MRELLLVAKHEYLKVAGKLSFLIGALGIPIVVLVMMLIGIVVALSQRGLKPIGYVDQAGVLAPTELPPQATDLILTTLRRFDDVDTAQTALEAGDLQAYYVLPEDYLESGRVELIYTETRPGELAQDDFYDFLRAHLVGDLPLAVQTRLVEGSDLTIRAADASREFATDNVLSFAVPFVAAFLFIIAVMNSAGYMLEAVSQEKENRTIEILVTSLSPEALIGGKALGLIGVGLTLLLIWITAGLLGLGALSFFAPETEPVTLPWSLIALVILFFVPAYTLMAGVMTAIGSVTNELRQAQQISGILNLVFMLPFFLLSFIFAKPNSPLVIALTLFPPTAFVTITLRWALVTIPVWQLLASWLLLTGSAVLCIWGAARLFRFGMLRYGQKLSLKSILTGLRAPRS